MLHPAFHISIELALACVAAVAIYALQRFRYSKIEHILRLPSNLRLTVIAFITAVLFLIYHGYLISAYPEWFLHCEHKDCEFNFLQGLGYLAGYNVAAHTFTDAGNHSRLIFLSINLLTFAVTFAFYFQHMNELRKVRRQLLKLQRKAELLLIRFDNQALDIRDEFIELYVEFDLRNLHFSTLHDAITAYRDDRSAANLNRVIDELKVAASIPSQQK